MTSSPFPKGNRVSGVCLTAAPNLGAKKSSLPMDVLHYQDLVKRYGPDMAYDLLLIVEKIAKISCVADVMLSEEERLQKALLRIEAGPSLGNDKAKTLPCPAPSGAKT